MAERTCLIVDDSKIVRKVMRKIIEPMGFNILEAEDGQQALDAFKEGGIELVMLDHAGHERDRLPPRPSPRAGRGTPHGRLLHDRKRHEPHRRGDALGRQRIHHEALRLRDYRVQVLRSRPRLKQSQ